MNQTDINSETPDLPDRTYDELKSEDSAPVSGNTALTCGEIRRLAGNQPELCMIGDSITWAEEGDWFRRHLLAFLPEIAFAGTHSALLGYSHAGEGGNSTIGVLNRIHDRKRVPDCPYYHLLIGINDASAAKRKEDIPEIASGIADSRLKTGRLAGMQPAETQRVRHIPLQQSLRNRYHPTRKRPMTFGAVPAAAPQRNKDAAARKRPCHPICDSVTHTPALRSTPCPSSGSRPHP